MMTSSEITALVSLLDENDEEILRHVREKLVSVGRNAIPFLDDMWSANSTSVLVQKRITHITHSIQLQGFDLEIRSWIKDEGSDLLDGVLIVNRINYPDLDSEEVRRPLESIKHQIWLELNEKLTAFEKVKVLNHFFFGVEGFKPNKSDYHSPDNSMISKVLATRTGNPLSLAILYLHIARRLEMPVYGINTPNHFLLAWVNEPDPTDPFADEDNQHPEVMFYINPFAGGAILQKEGIDSFLSVNGVKKDKTFYLPCDEMAIIRRMLNNLKNSYEKMGKKSKLRDISHLLELFVAIPVPK